MPLTVHDFIMGRPSRCKILDDFIAYAKQLEGVVFITHDEASAWWWKNYAPEEAPFNRIGDVMMRSFARLCSFAAIFADRRSSAVAACECTPPRRRTFRAG